MSPVATAEAFAAVPFADALARTEKVPELTKETPATPAAPVALAICEAPNAVAAATAGPEVAEATAVALTENAPELTIFACAEEVAIMACAIPPATARASAPVTPVAAASAPTCIVPPLVMFPIAVVAEPIAVCPANWTIPADGAPVPVGSEPSVRPANACAAPAVAFAAACAEMSIVPSLVSVSALTSPNAACWKMPTWMCPFAFAVAPLALALASIVRLAPVSLVMTLLTEVAGPTADWSRPTKPILAVALAMPAAVAPAIAAIPR